ncbi:MAG: hypothetical protein K2K37_06385 [Muribaculaceae bacterium]|nr:hypothetical protein [Muribaculaceae bacterium]
MKIFLLSILSALLLAGCSGRIEISDYSHQPPQIYPDYAGVTVPCNIAPLNFHVDNPQGTVAAIFRYGNDSIVVHGDDGDIEISAEQWRKMTAAPGTISVTVCADNGSWTAWDPFSITVSADSIDPTLVYRRIPPLYGTWRMMGIYQRDLEGFGEKAIYENTACGGNCVNCHSFRDKSPADMQLHMRSNGSATYIARGDQRYRLDTKTDSTIANFTYPYWHPSGRYIAYSVNDIFQVFHTSDPNVTEVIDDRSDVVVYDLDRNEVFSSPLLKSGSRLETFPAFSADGRRLYFCSAAKPDSLPQGYRDVKYSICAIDFNPADGTFGSSVDTLYNAEAEYPDCPGLSNRSMTVPRCSGDGRWLVATLSDYGNFKIWHKDADLWICDLATGEWRPMEAANSADVDSYHSWSGNSRWMVLSSRRDDGLYTRPYITHIDENGRCTKAFMLPQQHPKKFYTDQEDSYNIPEFVSGPVGFDTRDMADWIGSPSMPVNYR